VFWIGDASDTLFGHPQTKRILDPESRKRYETLLAEPFYSPRGYGALSNTGPDFPVIRDLFGEKAVSGRIEARLSHVLEVVKIRPGSRVEEHVQMDSLIEFFTRIGCVACRKRQAAATFGRETREPFCSRGVMGVVSAIPPGERFFRDGEFKPVPKALLRKRFPEYPFYGKKGGSDIPRTRFCQEGPFRNFFRDRVPPERFPSRGKAMIENPEWDWSFLTLSTAAFSVWQERVLKAERLEKASGTRGFLLGKPAAKFVGEVRG
jgi:hypothetical protein